MHPPVNKILSVSGHYAADSFAAANEVSGITLMEAAGAAVVQEIRERWSRRKTLVLCGPGNNGGDGFVVARLLQNVDWSVQVAVLGDPAAYRGDASRMLDLWDGLAGPLNGIIVGEFDLIVDAMFGAGLSRPLESEVRHLASELANTNKPVIAIDVPSGVLGDTGDFAEAAVKACLTVTFHRLKPAHVLEPSRSLCGEIVLADIGIPDGWQNGTDAHAELNTPSLWPHLPVSYSAETHKHRKGRLCIVSGGASASGAARLAAMAGLRSGAGLVTLLSPSAAMQVNAIHATAIMLKRFEGGEGLIDALDDRRATATVIGPGCGIGPATVECVIAATSREGALVLDADALTSFEAQPEHLFQHLREGDVLTPHEGEFRRLFPDILEAKLSKFERARMAAERAGCVIVYKGADTVIAAPDGRVRVNIHASPALATAGSGDVLAGMIGAFLGQGLDVFDAASAAAWLHGDAGIQLGEGLIAEDIPSALPTVFADLARQRKIIAARAALYASHKNA